MAGSIFNRVKTWISETLTAADINAEFNNILDNLDAEGTGGYSDNTTEMQAQTDPGEVGSESLASSLADELERLRYEIAQIKGTTYWYTNPVTSLSSLNSAFGDGTLPQTRLVSGATTGNSSQSLLLTPQGAGNGNDLVVEGTATSLVYYVNGNEYTLSSDVTISSTTPPPVTNNTATINEATLAGAFWTKYAGLYGTAIPIDNIGSEITSLNGKLAAFKVVNSGTETEYFLGTPDTTNNQIKDIKRGWFFDENGAPIPAITIADNDTITLMNIAWVFLKNDNTVSVTYNNPEVSGTQPSTPVIGDYWYDVNNAKWKVYDGASFNDSLSVWVGMGIIDENGDCVAARSEDFTKPFTSVNTSIVSYNSATTIKTNKTARIGVFGSIADFLHKELTWDITTDLESGTEATSVIYFFYVTESGVPKISLMPPIDFTDERGGYYHPHETWRCLAQAWNEAGGDLGRVISYHTDSQEVSIAASSVSGNALTLDYYTSPLVYFSMYDEDPTSSLKRTVQKRFPIYQSLTVPSGATLGHLGIGSTVLDNSDNIILHLVADTNYTTLAVSAHQRGQNELVSTTALGTASDNNVLYSNTAYTNAHCRAIALGTSVQSSAGAWATALRYFQARPNINACRKKAIDISRATGTSTTFSGGNTSFYFTTNRDIKVSMVSSQAGTDTSGSEIVIEDTAGGTSIGGIRCRVDSDVVGVLRGRINSDTAGAIGLRVPISCANWFIPQSFIDVGSGGDKNVYVEGATQDVAYQMGFDGTMVIEELPFDGGDQ